MKKISILLGTVAVISTFVSCGKKLTLPVNNEHTEVHSPFILNAATSQIKLAVNDDWSLSWEEGDIIYAVTTDEEWGVGSINDSADSIAEFTYDGTSFSTDSVIKDGEHTFKFLYAHSAQKPYHRGTSTIYSIPNNQVQDCSNPTAGIKSYYPLAGQATASTPVASLDVRMCHLATIVKVNLKNVTDYDIFVKDFTLSLPSASSVAGAYAVNFGERPSLVELSDLKKSVTVTLSGGTVAAGAELPVYVVLAPVTNYSGNITMTVTDAIGATYTRTNSVESLTFAAGTYNTASFSLKDPRYDNLPQTGLPVVVINTANSAPINSKEIWQEGATVTILNPDMTYAYQGTSEIKGRGNSTWWSYSKKPYTLKLNKKSKILGMPKDKRWNLLTNAPDHTNIRNSVGFYLAKQTTALGWTPDSRFVELVLNGQHKGLYLLCEHIKVSADRVAIEEMTSSDIDSNSITGGYLMELDNMYDEVNKFKTEILDLPVMFKEPDEDVLVEEQFNYMKDYFNLIESYITDTPIDERYKDLMDIESFADYFLVKEIVSNYELSIPRSIYMNKDRNGKLKMGPVWDFDLDPFYVESNFFWNTDSIWYEYLFKDTEFKDMVKRKWQELKPGFITVFDYIGDVRVKIKESAEANNAMWPITEENIYYCADYSMPYEDAVDRLTEGIRRKIEWLDIHIDEL